MTVWQKYLPTRIVSPVGEVKAADTALSQERDLGILTVVLTTVKNNSISAGPFSAMNLSLCNESFPLQILHMCKEANKEGKVNLSTLSYFSQGLENKGGGKKAGEHFVPSIFKTLGSTYKLWQQWDIEVPRWKNDSQGSFLMLIMVSDSSEWLKTRPLDTNLESVSHSSYRCSKM